MTINGRLLLLVVATGLFVRVWMANDRPRSRAYRRMPDRISALVTGPHPDSTGRWHSAATVAMTKAPHSAGCGEERWTAHDCPIALPAGIAAGTYRVVADSGRVARLDYERALAGTDEGTTVANPEFYVIVDGSHRWYIIRLKETTTAQPDFTVPEAVDVYGSAVAEHSLNHREFANRKFDFTGYVDAKWLDTPVRGTDEIACPEPPDLPVPR